MKAENNYQKAYDELLKIINEIEQDDLQLDKLSSKINRAKELLAFCRNKLREVEEAINEGQ